MPNYNLLPAAIINITGTVQPISSGQCTPATVILQPLPPGLKYVQQAIPTPKQPSPPLQFTGAGPINYVFADPTIRPIGVAFNFDGSASGNRGDLNLPLSRIRLQTWDTIPKTDGSGTYSGAGIQVWDAFVDSGTPSSGSEEAQYSWNYTIIFQTANGTIGFIDPSDENDNET